MLVAMVPHFEELQPKQEQHRPFRIRQTNLGHEATMKVLAEMGFTDLQANEQAILATGGDVEAAIATLVENTATSLKPKFT